MGIIFALKKNLYKNWWDSKTRTNFLLKGVKRVHLRAFRNERQNKIATPNQKWQKKIALIFPARSNRRFGQYLCLELKIDIKIGEIRKLDQISDQMAQTTFI